ncbi:hypothetical protein Tco_1285085 [Tanacetum coccineum]
MPLRDPNIYVSDLSFSGGGDDEGSAAANSVMHVSADGDCGVQQKGRPELGAPPPPRPPHPSQHHHRCHHQMTYYHSCLIRWQDGQQDPPQGPPYPLPDWSQQCSPVIGCIEASTIEADPSLVPLAPHQKLTGISMARN